MSPCVGRAKRIVSFLGAALFLLGAGSFKIHPALILGQDTNPPPQDMPFTVTGKIIDHSPGKLTLSSGQNMEFDVKYDSTTEIQHQDGTSAKVAELKVGIGIQVKGLLTEAGDIIAQKIVIQAKAGRSKGRSS